MDQIIQKPFFQKSDAKWFLSNVKRAIQRYAMIQPDERVAVALSGGKDSMVLLYLLHYLQQYSHLNFHLCAVHIDCGWAQPKAPLRQLCSQLSIPLSFENSCIAQAIFPERKPISNPCALCSRLRRGALVQWAAQNQCTKLALGHQRDDFVETAFLNLLEGGRYQAFAPRIDYADRGVSIIRPLLYLSEITCAQLAQRFQLPVVENPCPVNHHTQRQKIKQLLAQMRLLYPDLDQKVLHALEHDTAEQLWNSYYQRTPQ